VVGIVLDCDRIDGERRLVHRPDDHTDERHLLHTTWRIGELVGFRDTRPRQITDFGERTTFIARRVSWSSDGRSILAAVGEGDSDIVLLEGLTTVGRE
jgi:hypothetical protein